MAAVLAVVIGTAAATGSGPGANDRLTVDIEKVSPAGAGDQKPGAVGARPGSMAERIPAPPDAARDAIIATRDGRLVAQGVDLRVEEVALDGSITVAVDGQSREASSVYRVIVTAGPYVMRDMPAILAADGHALGVAAESTDLESLVLYTYDQRVVTDGVTVALSYGVPGEAAVEWSTVIEVAV